MAKDKNSKQFAERTLAHYAERLEADFKEEGDKSIENVYNGIATVIEEFRPTKETLLYVLEVIKFDMINNFHSETVGSPRDRVETLPERKPTAIGVA